MPDTEATPEGMARSSGAASRIRANRKAGRNYIAALDGLRAFAVLAVIFYHMGFSWAKGGLLGVTVFFVLSGYLITGLLTAEWNRSASINLPQFWLRRIRRLFPAIVVVIVVMAAVYTVCSPLLLSKMRPDIIPGLFWFENWWYILRDLSYFEAMGAPSPLTHFWSLAIEEQFYVVWPVILLLAFKAGAGQAPVRRGCLLLAVASAVAMAVMFDPQGDPSRVYYGTDTRAFSLLIGAWLSFVWPSGQFARIRSEAVDRQAVRMLDGVGAAAFLGIVAMCVFASGVSPFMYYGGLVLCSVLAALLIAVLVHPQSLLAKVASLAPCVWVGKISYGMYLWHFPIIALLQPRNATALPWWIHLVELALTVGAAALSYYLVEQPIRESGFKAFFALRGASAPSRKRRIPVLAVTGAFLAVALAGVALTPPVVEGGGDADEQRVMSAKLVKPLVEGVYDVVLVGDSVSLGANQALNERFPHGLMDTEGYRQFFDGIEVLQGHLDQGVVGDTVVISLSTNGFAEHDELEQVMSMCGPKRDVWFVNIRVPDERCEPNNQAIQACVDAHENAHLIDWYTATIGHDEWLIEDGIHLTEEGRIAYADLVVDTMDYVVPTDELTKYDVTFIGDSVALDAVDQLAPLFPRGAVDCSDARSMKALQEAVEGYASQGVVGDEVVVCLGDVEVLERAELEALLERIGADKKVWVVNARRADPWCEANNAVVAEVAEEAQNVQVIDWFAATQGHDDYLADNGVNLTDAGVAAYAQAVGQALGRTASAAER